MSPSTEGSQALHFIFESATDKEALPEESTWYIMTNLPGKIDRIVGNLYGDRTWIEAGFRNAKSELGWSDYKLTDYAHIEKWWEMVCQGCFILALHWMQMRIESGKSLIAC
ncbi:MAG: hypothetical protein KME03_18635 [Aphanocapsa lilacina HA4352-LM1]|jgi:SRSO17 transposase|nr:hypothetical protein [Aphanocapsa lilacina HA4352-LM1]